MLFKRAVLATFTAAILLCAFSAFQAQAQDELTLESLFEQLTVLKERVSQTERLLLSNAYSGDGGSCRIAMWKRPHSMSLVKYLDAFPDADLEDNFFITEVNIDPEGQTEVAFQVYNYPNQLRVVEFWSGCEFSGSSDWFEVDNQGRRIEEE